MCNLQNAGEGIVRTARSSIRKAAMAGAADKYLEAHAFGQICIAEIYLGAPHWIAEGARNEIRFLCRQNRSAE